MEPPELIRLAGAALFALLGAFVLARHRGRARPALGAAFLAAGALAVPSAIASDRIARASSGEATVLLGAIAAFAVAAACASAWAAHAAARDLPPTARRRFTAFLLLLVAAAAAGVALLLAAWQDGDAFGLDDGRARAASLAARLCLELVAAADLALLAALALRLREAEGSAARGHALLLLGFGSWVALRRGNTLGTVAASGDWLAGTGAMLTLCATLAALLPLRSTRAPWCTGAALGLLAAQTVGTLATAYLPADSFLRDADVGIVRCLGVALAGFAIFHDDVLGLGLSPRTEWRGTALSLSLAALFVAAQLLENLVNSLVGGLALSSLLAGSLLFGMFLLQRRAEARLDGGGRPAAIYRRQVELAWADGRLGTKERIMLGDLRARLGLAPSAAERIELDVARRRPQG